MNVVSGEPKGRVPLGCVAHGFTDRPEHASPLMCMRCEPHKEKWLIVDNESVAWRRIVSADGVDLGGGVFQRDNETFTRVNTKI